MIGRMTVEQNQEAYEQGEAPSCAWPVNAFVAWLATMLDDITRFKRARCFAPNWRDSWHGLRQSEWHRDQLIAQGVAQLLAGQPIQLGDRKIQLTPPASYGGACPRSPFEMSHSFIALARWAAEQEAIIRARAKRISRSLLAAHGSTDACSAATHEAVGVSTRLNAGACLALMVSSDRLAAPKRSEGGGGNARRTTSAGSPTPAARPPSPATEA